jgi:ATP-dependent Clp protease protease subunit
MSLVPMVIVNDGKGERSYDIYSRMLKERIIFIDGEINDQMASVAVASLLHLEAEDANSDIYMYINSPGGSVLAGNAIINTMDFIKPDVCTIVTGLAASMGSMLLTSGAKGKRYALPDSTVMIHQVSSGARGVYSDLEISLNETKRLRQALYQRLANTTGHTFEEIEKACDRDNYMSAAAAMEFGLVDRVIKTRADLAK